MLTQRDAGVIETLPHIKVPALVVVGADDTPFLAASDYMAAKIPGAGRGGDPGRRPRRQYRPAAGLHRRGRSLPGQPPAGCCFRPAGRAMRRLGLALFMIASSGAGGAPASAQHFLPQGAPPFSLPFTATLSNTTPLAFGMDEEQAARALGTPLTYISGRPGDEIFLVFRHEHGDLPFVESRSASASRKRCATIPYPMMTNFFMRQSPANRRCLPPRRGRNRSLWSPWSHPPRRRCHAPLRASTARAHPC